MAKSRRPFFNETKMGVSLTLPILMVGNSYAKGRLVRLMWNGVGAAHDWTLIYHGTYEMMWSLVLWHHFGPFRLMNLEKSWNLAPQPPWFFFVPSTYVAQSSVNDWARELRPFLTRDAFQTFRRFCNKMCVFFPIVGYLFSYSFVCQIDKQVPRSRKPCG